MEPRTLSVVMGDEAIADLRAGRPVSITLTPRRAVLASRAERVKEDRLAAGIHSPDVQRLIDAWNMAEYVVSHPHEGRNKPISDEEAQTHKAILDKTVKTFGLKSLLELLGVYFAACAEGRHIQNGRNVGYGNLAGFVRRMVDARGDRRKLWWAGGRSKIPDSHPELTRNVADAYARRFLGRPAYGLKNPSAEYREFATAADWIELTSPKTGFSPSMTTRYLLDCIEEQAKQRGRSVTPGWLSSELTWKNTLPQYIKQHIIG